MIRRSSAAAPLLLVMLTFTALLQAQITFQKSTCCPGNWKGPVMIDVNHDGFPDLISGDSSGNINVFLNDGTGHFATTPIKTASGLRAINQIAAADFDRDGNIDVVATESSFDGIAVMYGNPDHTFSNIQIFHITPFDTANSIVVGDFMADGFPWVAFATDLNGIYLMRNDGVRIQAPVLMSAGDYEFLQVGQLGGKGSDLAAIQIRDNQATIVRDVVKFVNLFNSDAQPEVKFQKTVVETGTGTAMVLSDVDRDGLSDFVVTFFGAPSGVSILFNNPDGTIVKRGFTIPENDPATNQVQSLFGATAGDLNGDGRTDIGAVVAGNGVESHDKFAYVINNGNRTFGPVQYFDLGLNNVPGFAVTSDINKNQRDEVLIPSTHNNDFIVLYPSGPATCSMPTSAGVHICAPANGSTQASPVTVTASATGVNGTVKTMKIYVDGTSQFTTASNMLSTALAMSIGTHRITVKGWGATGTSVSSTVNITVANTGGPCVSPATAANNTVTICAPASGSTVSSPVHVTAAFKTTSSATGSKVYVDGVSTFNGGASKNIDANLIIGSGSHRITVKFWTGSTSFSSSVSFTVH
jgi:FG-GAP-like repeat/Bacterial Ig domain